MDLQCVFMNFGEFVYNFIYKNKEVISFMLNAKIKILQGDNSFQTGKVYDIKDGRIWDAVTLCKQTYPIPSTFGKGFSSEDDVRVYFANSSVRSDIIHSIMPGVDISNHPFVTGYSSEGIEFEFV